MYHQHQQMPKFIFFGTPELAVLHLEQLAIYGMVPSLIVTVPAKPMGRGLVLTPNIILVVNYQAMPAAY